MTDLHGADELERALQQIAAQLGAMALQAAPPAMTEATDFLLSAIPPYPAPPQAGALQATTDKARRFFFWAVKQGKIKDWKWVEGTEDTPAHAEGAYVRTGNLGQHFTTEVKVFDDSVTGAVGTNTEYAPWVVGPDYPGEEINGKTMWQARIHEGRWWQFGDVIAQNIEDAWAIFDEEFFKELEKRFKNGGA